MVKVNILRRTIRRHRVNMISDDQIYNVFIEALERLANFTSNLEGKTAQLREYEKDLLIQFESKISKVNKSIERKEYNNSITLLADARDLKNKIINAIKTIENYNEVKKIYKDLVSKLSFSKWFENLPSIKVVGKILEDSHKLMKQGKYLQANGLIKFCSIEVRNAETKSDEIDDLKVSLLQKIEYLKEICKETFEYTIDLKEDVLEIKGRVENVILSLIENNQYILAKNLLEDLEFALRHRINFRNRLIKHQPLVVKYKEELLAEIKHKKWLGGIEFLLMKKMELFSNQLVFTEERLLKTQENKI